MRIRVVSPNRALPVLGQPPTARREFFADEKLEVHAEFYEPPPPDVDVAAQLKIVTRLLTAGGSVLFETEDHGTSEALPGGRWGYEHSTLVPIAGLPPGEYAVQGAADTLYDTPAAVVAAVPIVIR